MVEVFDLRGTRRVGGARCQWAQRAVKGRGRRRRARGGQTGGRGQAPWRRGARWRAGGISAGAPASPYMRLRPTAPTNEEPESVVAALVTSPFTGILDKTQRRCSTLRCTLVLSSLYHVL
ncbi:unnamed protein product, partial [Urochloa humidicola]